MKNLLLSVIVIFLSHGIALAEAFNLPAYELDKAVNIEINTWQKHSGDLDEITQIHNADSWQEHAGHGGDVGDVNWFRTRLNYSSASTMYLISYLLPHAQIKLVDSQGQVYYSKTYGTLVTTSPAHILGIYANPLPLVQGESWLYYRSSSFRFTQPTLLKDTYHFSKWVFIEGFKNWLFIGIAIVVMLHNFFLWLATRSHSYIIYSGYVISTSIIISGFIFTHHGETPGSFILYFPFLAPLANFLIQLFARDLLEAGKNFPRSSVWVYRYSQALFLAPVLAIFTDLSTSWYFILLACLPSLATITLWGFFSIRHKRPGALAYSVGWVCFLVSIIVYAVVTLTSANDNQILAQAPMLGFSLEMLILTIAIGQKVNYQKAQRSIKTAENRNLQDLVRVLCHDLANPLSVIISSAEICTMPQKSDGNPIWPKIQAESNTISQLISKVRFIEAVNNNKLRLPTEKLNLVAAVEQAINNLKSEADKKHITIHKKGECFNDHYVLCTKAKINELIIDPILHNAIKYSYNTSQIEIFFRSSLDEVVVEFRDYGIGIPDYIVEHLLEGSSFISTRGTNDESGLGLSLAVAHAAMSQVGGRLAVASEQGEYTSISLSFRKVFEGGMERVA